MRNENDGCGYYRSKLNGLSWRARTRGWRTLFAALGGIFALTLIVNGSNAAPQGSAHFSHQPWDALLKQCVESIDGGDSTAADYQCFQSNHEQLKDYTTSLSSVSDEHFASWDKKAQLAFLINAYNAWTVELILSAWPELESIRDLGSLFRSPWKKEFIPLFDGVLSLDDIEHGMIREPGVYDDPRIHFAVNCASVGCPALRAEAYTGERLDAQLEEQTRAFLGDSSRNRLRDGRLEVSSIFKWYGDDFAKGWRGADSLGAFLARYASAMQLDTATTKALQQQRLKIDYLDYDWSLNDLP